MKTVLGIALSLIAVVDLISWMKRRKLDNEAVWNGVADVLIIAYTIL